MKLKFTLLALVMACFCRDGARGQSVCVTQLNQVSAVGTSPVIDNRFTMCSLWIVTYNQHGFATLSLELDTANDTGGTPGTFALSTGTVLQGANPSTATNCQTSNACQFIINGYAPFVRLNFASKTGTGSLTALGFGFTAPAPIAVSSSPSVAGGCPGTNATPCIVAGPDAPGSPSSKPPVQIAGNDGANIRAIITDTAGRTVEVGAAPTGAAPVGNPVLAASLDGAGNVLPLGNCTNTVAWTASATGNTQIIAASGSTVIRICAFEFTPDTSGTTVNWKLQTGTGVNCATGPADLTGLLSNVLAYSNNLGPQSAWVTPAGKAVCYNMASGTSTHGTVVFSQY